MPRVVSIASNKAYKGNVANNIIPSSDTPVKYNPNSNKDTDEYRKSIESVSPKIGTTFFMANVTSLSPHALEYLFTEQKDVDILSIVETSIVPNKAYFYKQKFDHNNNHIYSNNGVPSPLGGKAHGGELHAVKKHLNSMPIDQQVYSNIEQ